MSNNQAEALTPDEHQELLHLVDQIEKSDGERVKHLADLARLRGTSLTAVMEDLGIHPPAYA